MQDEEGLPSNAVEVKPKPKADFQTLLHLPSTPPFTAQEVQARVPGRTVCWKGQYFLFVSLFLHAYGQVGSSRWDEFGDSFETGVDLDLPSPPLVYFG